MKLSQRLDAFGKLGKAIHNLGINERKSLAEKARNENAWFTEENIFLSLRGIEELLQPERLGTWAGRYTAEPSTVKTVGVAMAGNIPMVGFHDFLCVLTAGHQLKAKSSAEDSVLIRFILQKLIEIEPHFQEAASFVDRLNGMDAVIATGSDNTARYFEYYFRNIPHILRKNRSSCAVLQGDEPIDQMAQLGQDVFSYFGLGCRNVSKIFIPEEFGFKPLIESWSMFEPIAHHHKYANNYDYQKSVLLMDSKPFLDTGFILLRESLQLVSPIATLFYEKYKSLQDLKEKLQQYRDKIQIITSAQGWYPGSIPFGKGQLPKVDDYADGVDTMRFLTELR